jgi:tryptophan synthase alpha chain
MNPVTAAIRGVASPGPALVAYLTAGFPRREGFAELLAAVAAAADVVEIGVPFSDPMADGRTIQRSSRIALAGGASLRWLLEALASASRPAGTPVLLMSYLNPLLAFGVDALPTIARRAGVAGFIVPDLPLEESAAFSAALARENLSLVQFVAPATPQDRAAKLCAASRGFVYALTTTGVTGQDVALPEATLEYLSRLRRMSPVPVCAGFGIRHRAQVDRLAPSVDGVIVGSALVEAIERGEDAGRFLQGLRPSRTPHGRAATAG